MRKIMKALNCLILIVAGISTGCAADVGTGSSLAANGAVKNAAVPAPEVPNPVATIAIDTVVQEGVRQVPVTFAQPFKEGDVGSSQTLQAITFKGKELPTQVDWKASNRDGSRRHGIITLSVPEIDPGQQIYVGLYETPAKQADHSATLPEDLSVRAEFDIKGTTYTASLQDMAAELDRTWLSGPLVTEWHFSGPAISAAGREHDRIWVQFYIRHYHDSNRTRVAVVVENTWAFKSNPRNVNYDARVLINDSLVYQLDDLTHTDRARWRKVFWKGAPKAYIRHDLNYLKATGAIPNYDPTLRVPDSTTRKFYKKYLNSDREPMEISIVLRAMGTAGGRPDIGPLPKWTVLRLLTMDPRLIEVDQGIGALAGSWPVHLRDEETGLPVSLENHPKLTIHPNLLRWKKNPLPIAEYGEYPNRLRPDVSHQPSFAFVPYLLTGEYYYLEELQFWASWNPLRTSPKYRGYDEGLLKWMQVRGQAWSMRTLGQTAYITPDDHPMKNYWKGQLQKNLEWYNARYPENPDANELGFLASFITYNKGRGLAPWQDDFFTWAMGYLVDLGFENAHPMLIYKARFPVGRMTAPGYCWIRGAIYKLNVRDSKKSPFYDTFAKAYKETVDAEKQKAECGSAKMAKALGKGYKAGDMSGYPRSPQGFPSNMQPALATAVDAGVPGADQAWQIFMNRTTKPNYSSYPNWAIVPRK